MCNQADIQQSFQQDTQGTLEFKSYFEEMFQTIDEMNRRQAIKVTPVTPLGQARVKKWMQ